jgi:hypothetical protein
MAQEYDQYQNWGANGGGNHYILYSLIEAISREKISAQDTVAIMWTSVGREDRFVQGQWMLHGSVYYSPLPKDYVDQFTDPTGFFLTNITVIDAVKKILDSIGCQYHFFSILPFEKVDDSFLELIFPLKKNIESQVRDLYKDTLHKIQPSVYQVIFNQDWHSRDHVIIPSAQKEPIQLFQIKYDQCAGPDWPSFDDFMADRLDGCSADIIEELEQQFQFVTRKNSLLSQRQDSHPIPSEHAEYLEKVGIQLTQRQKDYVQHWNEQVLTDPDLPFAKRNKIERF